MDGSGIADDLPKPSPNLLGPVRYCFILMLSFELLVLVIAVHVSFSPLLIMRCSEGASLIPTSVIDVP